MSYSCEPVLSIDIDGKDFFDYDYLYQERTIEEIDAIIRKLKSKKLNIPRITNNPVFFEDIHFYLQTHNIEIKSHEDGYKSGVIKFNKIVLKFKDILTFFTEDEEFLFRPIDILEILFVVKFFSKNNPELNIIVGIGDMGLFWVDLTIKNGELIKYKTFGADENYETINDPNIEDLFGKGGFICSKEEMEEFFNKKIQEL